MINNEIREYKDKILQLRSGIKYDEALRCCDEAITTFPLEFFFYKIKGDILYQNGMYSEASEEYIQFLLRIPDNNLSFSDFASRYNRLKKVVDQVEITSLAARIHSEVSSNNVSTYINQKVEELIIEDIEIGNYFTEDGKALIGAIENKLSWEVMERYKKLEANDIVELERVIDRLVFSDSKELWNYSFFRHCMSFYEKQTKYLKALKLGDRLLEINFDSIVTRTYFRICRTINDYDKVYSLIIKYPNIIKSSDFNVLYELVYFYEWQKNIDQVYGTLQSIEKNGIHSLAIQKTAKNFYLRFGYLEDADRVDAYITSLYSKTDKSQASTKNQDAVEESQAFIWSTIKDLSTKLEHEQQITAIADLTRGISHELGQPLTNIRYTIQFYSKVFNEQLSKTEVLEIFSSILEETERMGGLIKRLSPITSSRNTIEYIDIIEKIKKRVAAEMVKIRKYRINVNIKETIPIHLFIDPIKFDQIISNLLLNAIDAIDSNTKINKQNHKRQIYISIDDDDQFVKIFFTDTGTGIPIENRAKIFEPFFSTKPTGKGEGLGLFIVWNLIKSMGGVIHLDVKYKHGTSFVIVFPKHSQEGGDRHGE